MKPMLCMCCSFPVLPARMRSPNSSAPFPICSRIPFSFPIHGSRELTNCTLSVHMGPFSLQVAEQLVPSYIEGMGLEGKIKFNREGTSDNSRPDCVITFDDKPIISFDYKGPNCVRDDELEQCTVASVTEAKEKIAQWGKILQRFAQGHEKQGDTMLRVQGITIDTERLTQTAIKYAKQVGTPVVIFYDFDTLTVMKPPSGMVHDNDNLMEVRIWREPQKSTEDNLVETQDNHVSILIRHIVDMVHRVKAEE